MSFITVMFTCHGTCGLSLVRVPVMARYSGEDIAKFIERVSAVVGKRHHDLAPACGNTVYDLLLPIPDEKHLKAGDGIGHSAPELPEVLGPELQEKMKSRGAN